MTFYATADPGALMRWTDRLLRFAPTIEAGLPPIGTWVAGQHCVVAGPPGAPVLVLVHGASGNLRDWTASILTALAARWRVVAFDRPGFGYSPGGPGAWALSAQIDAMRGALAAMGIGRYAVLGHSYGATLALAWAARHGAEVAGVLALSGPLASWRGRIAARYTLGRLPLVGAVAARLVPLVVTPTLLAGELAEVFAPQPVPADYVAQGGVMLALRPSSFLANLQAMARFYDQTREVTPHLADIACPVEVVHGDADRVIPWVAEPGPLGMLAPQARLTLLPGIGHMPHHTAPEAVLAAADRLAARLDR